MAGLVVSTEDIVDITDRYYLLVQRSWVLYQSSIQLSVHDITKNGWSWYCEAICLEYYVDYSVDPEYILSPAYDQDREYWHPK